jgi:dihydroorotate dehydrogenase electron transfer subunit
VTDHFAGLLTSGEPAEDVKRFYLAVGHYSTLKHVIRVARVAQRLAGCYGADREAAEFAALAHDLGVAVPDGDRLAVAKQVGIEVSAVDELKPMLLHGPIAAAALAEKLGVRDEDVLNAVRYHTTLRAGASKLEKIVFLADKIAFDPSADHKGAYLADLEASPSLDGKVLVYLEYVLGQAGQPGWILHPNAIAAYRELVGHNYRGMSLPRVAQIVDVRAENANIRTMVLDVHLEAEPGQFVMVWLPGVDEKPFSLVRAEPVTLTVARVGPFTSALHALGVGDPLWLRGPLGRPFTLPPAGGPPGSLLLIGGGYGVAPMYFLAECALAAGREVSVVIGARTAADVIFAERFTALGAGVTVTTEDGSQGRQGLATDAAARLLDEAGYQAIYACGPEPMLEAVEGLAHSRGLPAQLSYERTMRCGFGVCGSCARKGWLVCRDGPVKYVRCER